MPTTLPWRFRYSNLRSHRKILVADGRVGFTGGMNIREGALARSLRDHVAARISEAHAVTLEELRSRPMAARLRDGVARLASPYLYSLESRREIG